MKINRVQAYYQNNSYRKPKQQYFIATSSIETIKHYNIGMMENGIIGKVRVFDKNGVEKFLNVVKDKGVSGQETYMFKDNIGKIIGEITLKIMKYDNYEKPNFIENPSYVWVEFLRNYSNPNTEYYHQGLSEYKYIGTRLLQIAQRRSDEAQCGGNIHLCSKDSSKDFYKKLGFRELPTLYDYKQNSMYLPSEAKEPLSKIQGGL